jgi:hypothetical protein
MFDVLFELLTTFVRAFILRIVDPADGDGKPFFGIIVQQVEQIQQVGQATLPFFFGQKETLAS